MTDLPLSQGREVPHLRGVCKKKRHRLQARTAQKGGSQGRRRRPLPGFSAFDPAVRGDYGYGTMQNVVTSLDFERLLCATGPTRARSCARRTRSTRTGIAWIHCVGFAARSSPGGNSYCSSVCCTYIQKQGILTKDHYAELDATIFHNDIRAYGKDFERFYQSAANLARGPVHPGATCRSGGRFPSARTSRSGTRPKAKA